MHKLFISLIILFGCYFAYAEYQSGYCGSGMFNQFPLGLNTDYVNGYSINDEYGFNVIRENYNKSDDYILQQDVRNIFELAYDEKALYLRLDTHENENFYAILDELTPSSENIKFLSYDDFNQQISDNLNWISTKSPYCDHWYFRQKSKYWFFALLGFIGFTYVIAWLVDYRHK